MKVLDLVRPQVVTSEVEPRIVERRRTVLVARRRTRRRQLIAGLVAVGLVAAAAGALVSPLTDVDRIVITGDERLTEQDLAEVTGLRRGDQLISLDLASIRSTLREDPTIASASVAREWPDTVRVVLVPETPSARVRGGGRELLVSATGRVMPVGTAGADLVPVLEVDDRLDLEPGSDVPPEVQAAIVAIRRMPPALRAQISSGGFTAAGGLTVELDDGTTIRFGPLQDLPAKVVAAVTTLDQVVRECMDVLDVRVPTRSAVTRRADCDTPPPTETAPDEGADAATEGVPSGGTDR